MLTRWGALFQRPSPTFALSHSSVMPPLRAPCSRPLTIRDPRCLTVAEFTGQRWFTAEKVEKKVPFNPEEENTEVRIKEHNYDYDLLVIGGGSGGIAAAKEASKLGASVALLDYVVPSSQNNVWGLGGTCVNVGCIPKKLMHQAALIGSTMEDAKYFGWNLDKASVSHTWSTLIENLQNHIKSLNFGYRNELRTHGVEYKNEYGKFIDSHTVECINKRGEKVQRTAKTIIVAVGERPFLPEIPGVEHAITSDDLFSLQTPPGKTLLIGGGYVALEFAGLLNGIGFDTTVIVRSLILRGFDQQMAEMIRENLEEEGVRFIHKSVPTSIQKLPNGKLRVEYTSSSSSSPPDGEMSPPLSEEFDTVVMATGRKAHLDALHLDRVGVRVGTAQKIIANENDVTTNDNIYALGDVALGRPELTPTAIQAGKFLARRLYLPNALPRRVLYSKVPTTVFTPIEYAFVGLSEQDAIAKVGDHAVEAYHSYFQPLEFRITDRPINRCYLKIIVNKTDHNRVLGIHLFSPNAGEIMQGYAVAMQMNVKLDDLENTVGIHPTIAEELVSATAVTKSSGDDPQRTGC